MTDIPAKLGKFIIESELGNGSMGTVYKAVDPFIHRTVALKTISRTLLNDIKSDTNLTDTLITRFKREAQAAGKLNHPNIVSVYEYGEDQNTAFIAMEYVQGRSLKEIFDQNERFDIHTVIGFMSQLLGALTYSHKHGIVHRDIKPANIIIMPDGQIKITDFGIAHIASSDLTQSGTMLGTPNYMSPEQFMGHPVDGRSDLFSAGIIFYQLVTGENPFDGRSMATVMHKVLSLEPLDSITLNYQVTVELNQVIKKALAKKPEDRFQNAEAFRLAIGEAFKDSLSAPQKSSAETISDTSHTVILSEQISKSEKEHTDTRLTAFNPYETFLVTTSDSNAQSHLSLNEDILSDQSTLPSGPDALIENISIRVRKKWAVLCGAVVLTAAVLIFSIGRFTKHHPPAASDVQNDLTQAATSEAARSSGNSAEYAEVIAMLNTLGRNTAPADLSLWTEKNQFKINDRIRYYFNVLKDCYVVVFCLTTDNKVFQIFPNRYRPDDRVLAGQTVVLLDDTSDRALSVTGPAGWEEVIALVSDQPIHLFSADFRQQLFVELSESPGDLENIRSRIQAVQNMNLSRKVLRYQIIDH